MYNSEIKEKFIKHYTRNLSTTNMCTSVFNQMEPFELIWNADLCTKSAVELQQVIDGLVGLRTRSKWMKLIILKDYVKWCLEIEHFPGACDGMFQVNPAGLDVVKRQTVVNPLHLQRYLDCVYTPESSQTIDNIFRCYYWLAYGGVAEDDILKVKIADVDFGAMVVHYKGTEIPIYREAMPAFKNSVELTSFCYDHSLYKRAIWIDRIQGDTLIRGFTQYNSIKALRVGLSKKSKEHEQETHLRLSYFRVWISGVFYRAYERELLGEKVDFGDIVAEQTQGKTYNLSRGQTLAAKRRQLVRDYLDDYARWKLAYGL